MNEAQQSTTKVDLSIVIPAWNEARRLPKTLSKVAQFQKVFPGQLEVLIADDGSTDNTLEQAMLLSPELTIRTVSATHRKGPGDAVKRGVLASHGRRVLISDADGPVPFDDAMMLWAALDAGADLAVGSRVKNPSSVLLAQPWHRVIMGKIWRSISQALVPTGVLDTQCGFKLMEGSCARSIFEQVESRGFGFHVEALYYAQKHGYKIVELPVRWNDVPGSKIHLVKDPIVMLGEVLRISLRKSRISTSGTRPISKLSQKEPH